MGEMGDWGTSMGDTDGVQLQPPKEILPVRLRHYLYGANMVAFMILAMTTSEETALLGFFASVAGLIVYNADLTKRREILRSLEIL